MTALQKPKKSSFSRTAKSSSRPKSRIKTLLRHLFFLINICFAAVLLFSYSASFINPTVSIFPSLLGLAYPYLLIINIFFIILWATSFRIEFLLSLTIVLLGFNHISEYFQINRPNREDNNELKILSYNVLGFNDKETGESTFDSIISFLKIQNADIVCLQEFPISYSELFVKEIAPSLGYTHSHLLTNSSPGDVALFSKFPIVKRDIVSYSESSVEQSIVTDIAVGSDTIRIFNNHLQSFKLKKMSHSFLSEIADSESEAVKKTIKETFVNLRNGFNNRATQTPKLHETIKQSPYLVISVGDFNDTPLSYTYNQVSKGLRDAFIEKGNGAGFTYRGKYPSYRIDFIFHDKILICNSFDIVKINYSDHYPIIASFSLSN